MSDDYIAVPQPDMSEEEVAEITLQWLDTLVDAARIISKLPIENCLEAFDSVKDRTSEDTRERWKVLEPILRAAAKMKQAYLDSAEIAVRSNARIARRSRPC